MQVFLFSLFCKLSDMIVGAKLSLSALSMKLNVQDCLLRQCCYLEKKIVMKMPGMRAVEGKGLAG